MCRINNVPQLKLPKTKPFDDPHTVTYRVLSSPSPRVCGDTAKKSPSKPEWRPKTSLLQKQVRANKKALTAEERTKARKRLEAAPNRPDARVYG